MKHDFDAQIDTTKGDSRPRWETPAVEVVPAAAAEALTGAAGQGTSSS